MTLIWCLSPLLGFFLVPLLGSLSDRCKLKLGRRRPFILLLSAGIILGLILVPNGRNLGVLMGDKFIDDAFVPSTTTDLPMSTTIESTRQNDTGFNVFFRNVEQSEQKNTPSDESTEYSDAHDNITEEPIQPRDYPHPFTILFTVLGVILLDFSCDACQSPCRAYMLDVTVPEDHPRGLSTFTVLAGKCVYLPMRNKRNTYSMKHNSRKCFLRGGSTIIKGDPARFCGHGAVEVG